MDRLIQHLDRELSEDPIDPLYVNTLRTAIKEGGLTLEMFRNTGRYIPRYRMSEISPNTILHQDCDNVLVYMGNFYIQIFKDGTYYLDDSSKKIKRKKADTIEKYLWNNYASEMFNGDK